MTTGPADVSLLNLNVFFILTGNGYPVFTGEVDCTYYFNWQTSYACVKKTKDLLCRVTDGKMHYDLSRLTRYAGER